MVNLEDKGLIKRHWNRARAIEVLPTQEKPEARDVPLAGLIAAGEPIEAVRGNELVAVPEDMIGRRDVYVLKVRGESMVDEQVRDGDYVIVENRTDPEKRRNGRGSLERRERDAQEVLPREEPNSTSAGAPDDEADFRSRRRARDPGSRCGSYA